VPGKKGNKAVDVYYTLPVKFKIKQPDYDPDYVNFEGDTIWVKFDEVVDFRGGEEAYDEYLAANLEYPFIGNIDCLIGAIEVKILVRSDGSVKVMDITDYNNLGIHFWYEAIDFIHKSRGQWKPAVFGGRAVNGTFSARIEFIPTFKCKDIIANYEKASADVDEAIKLFEEDQLDQSIEKFTAAVTLFPENPEFLALRGQAYLEADRTEEACADLRKVRRLLSVDWYDQFLPFLCK
jgi:tetratricopeptide (TPR) repeat protein